MSKSNAKDLLIAFLDCRELIMGEWVLTKQIVNAIYYREIVLKLRPVYQTCFMVQPYATATNMMFASVDGMPTYRENHCSKYHGNINQDNLLKINNLPLLIDICIANHYNNLTIDFYLYTMPRRNLVTHAKYLKRQKWNDDMQRAIVAVQKRECETKLAAQRYSVPRSTLQCYLKKEDVTTKLLGHCPVLGVATELELAHYIKLMESKLLV